MINCSIKILLPLAIERLHGSESPKLDTQILMAHILQTSREAVLAWPDRQLDYEQLELFELLLCRREQGEPIAYVTGKKAFWNIELNVTQAVLVPRPETELIVESALNLTKTKKTTTIQ